MSVYGPVRRGFSVSAFRWRDIVLVGGGNGSMLTAVGDKNGFINLVPKHDGYRDIEHWTGTLQHGTRLTWRGCGTEQNDAVAH